MFNFPDIESCDVVPVSESFSLSCQDSDPCGAHAEAEASGSLNVSPQLDGTSELLTGISVSASVHSRFASFGGATCMAGARALSTSDVRIAFEVVDSPVTAMIAGSLNLDSSGSSAPVFKVFKDAQLVLDDPRASQSLAMTFELQPGTHELEVFIGDRNPDGNSSDGRYSLSLQFD